MKKIINRKIALIAQDIYDHHFSIDMADEEGAVKEIIGIIKEHLKEVV